METETDTFVEQCSSLETFLILPYDLQDANDRLLGEAKLRECKPLQAPTILPDVSM